MQWITAERHNEAYISETRERDLIITLTTMCVCLYYGVEIGLLVGVIANLAHLIYLWARPTISIDKCKNEFGEYVVVTPDLGLFYLAIDHLYTILSKNILRTCQNIPVAVNCCYFKGIDYSALKGLSMIVEDFHKRGQRLVFFNATDDIIKMCRKSGCKNLKFCAFDQNLDEFLFGDLQRCTTIPMIEKEMEAESSSKPFTENEVPLLERPARIMIENDP